jgi:Permuted papain-like amidase enzyme, YaeF/YiiX, C92 family
MAETFIDSVPALPRSATFESGDFVWPKKPGVFVPYTQGVNRDPKRDQEIWEKEKREFINRAAKDTYLTERQIDSIRRLDYREFLARYHADQRPDNPGVYSSGGGLYVGHVGIVEVSATGEIDVIEALWDQGVVRQSYKKWLADRAGEIVWHGRLAQRSNADRERISVECTKHIGRPYEFWNFDLNDDRGFYCSKLVWLSVFRALQLAIDANPNPKRDFWFSPKKLLYLPTIDRLHDPGAYAYL